MGGINSAGYYSNNALIMLHIMETIVPVEAASCTFKTGNFRAPDSARV